MALHSEIQCPHCGVTHRSIRRWSIVRRNYRFTCKGCGSKVRFRVGNLRWVYSRDESWQEEYSAWMTLPGLVEDISCQAVGAEDLTGNWRARDDFLWQPVTNHNEKVVELKPVKIKP